MPVAPYDTDKYREWNRNRMRHKRATDRRYAEYDERWKAANPLKVILAGVKSSAKRRGIAS